MRGIQTALATSIRRVSAGGRFFYTERQLYFELCRTLRQWAQYWRGVPFSVPAPVSYTEFSQALKRHISHGGIPPMLLLEAPSRAPGFLSHEKDLADYGLPRLLVCTDRNIAAMIIANHMHMELGCAVLSLAEASPLPDLMCALLARAEDPEVYLLHDADLEGIALSRHIRTRLRLPENVISEEVGLRPHQATKMHLFIARTGLTADEWHLPRGLTHFERLWVKAGFKAEVAGIAPAALFRLLRKTLVFGT